MPSVYIAGPMRGIKDFNFDAFYEAEVEVHNRFCDFTVENPAPKFSSWYVAMRGEGIAGCEDGVTIFNPARRDHDRYGANVNRSETGDLSDLFMFDLREALGADLDWIAKNATHIYMLDGWESSKGATAEHALAQALGLEVLYQGNPAGAIPISPPGSYAYPVSEVRVTSATGGQKGQKLSQMGALDPLALKVVGEVAGFGAKKYARYNYLKGYDWSLSYDAGQRHLMEFWSGNDLDEESGLPHVAHAAWQALALLSFYLRGVGTDDRPPAMG